MTNLRNKTVHATVEKLVDAWACLVVEFSKAVRLDNEGEMRDASYWCGEQNNIAQFAIAANACGIQSLVEFGERKSGQGRTRTGRIDLWLNIGDNGLAVEAKHCYLGLSSSLKPRDSTSDTLDAADEDCSTLNRSYRDRLALAFIVPRFKHADNVQRKSEIQRFNDGTLSVHSNIRRWVELPLSPEELPQHNGVVFPGVLLLGRFHHVA